MPFGAWKGTELSDVPAEYIAWLAGLHHLRDPLRGAVLLEFERRGARRRPAYRSESVALHVQPDHLPLFQEVIENGYRTLSRKFHPDATGDSDDVEMKRLNELVAAVREQFKELAS